MKTETAIFQVIRTPGWVCYGEYETLTEAQAAADAAQQTDADGSVFVHITNLETDTINPRNYSLCEAAPDLLAALIKCNQVLGKSETHCDQTTGLPISPLLIEVRTAIAKANGLL